MPRWDAWKQARRALNVAKGRPARWRGIGDYEVHSRHGPFLRMALPWRGLRTST